MSRCLFCTLACLGLSLAALFITRPTWAKEYGLDLWNLAELRGRLDEQQKLAAELERQQSILVERMAAKEEVLRGLLTDRVTLVEAAAEFRRLDATPPEYAERSPDYFAGKSEGERYCREVVQWVRYEPEEDAPGRMERIAQQLEEELEVYLATHDGEVILSDD